VENSKILKVSIALVTTIVFWASAFVGIRVALNDFSPSHLALLRFLFASVAMLMLAPLMKIRLLDKRDVPMVFLAGFIGITCYNLLLNAGEQTVTAASASLLVNTVPIWTTILAQLFLSERTGRYGYFGMLICFAGAAIIIFAEGDGLSLNIGAVMVMLAAVSQAAYFILQKPLLRKYNSFEFTAYAIWFGTLALLPFGTGLMPAIGNASAEGFFAAVFLGICPAAIAYITWGYALANLPAGRAASFLYFVPVVAVLIGWLWLSEMPSAYAMVGGVIVLFGVFVINARRWPPIFDIISWARIQRATKKKQAK
jgi:drug/metabolite transporter (DMT)-like permease